MAKEVANSEMAKSLLQEIMTKGPLSCSSPAKPGGKWLCLKVV